MRNFDKLLLTFLVMFFTVVTVIMMWRNAGESTIDWAAGLVTMAIGSLVTLITGNYRSRAAIRKIQLNQKRKATK